MKFRSAFAVLSMTVALTACGGLPFQNSAMPEAPAHSGPPTVSPLEQPIETGAAGIAVATAEASTTNTAMFRAAGAGWTVSAADKTAVYERPGQKSVGTSVRRMSYARGVEFIGSMNGQVFALNIQAAECDAGGQKTPFTAKLRVGSQRLTGCAVATDTMPKAQVKASGAAPKPKAVAKPKPPAQKPAETAPEAVTPATTTPAPTTPAPTAPVTTAPEAPATTAPVTTAPEKIAPVDQAPASPAPAVKPPAEAPADSADKPAATAEVPAPAPVLPVPPAPSE